MKKDRILMLVDNNLTTKRLETNMSDSLANIWVEVSGPGIKKIVVGGVYREHRLMIPDNKESSTENAQFTRWTETCNQWLTVT